jgi:CheY-like chemotaxis protein
MKTRVLLVDDERNVLSGYRRLLGRRYDFVTAEGGAAALKIMGEQPSFPVVITDMRMPEMDGIEFLRTARTVSKDSVYAMLTGNADQQTAIDAINQGQIFRFLTKPCPPEVLENTIEACARQHELLSSERMLLRQTLTGSIKLLMEALGASDPELRVTMSTIRHDAQRIADSLGCGNEWRLPIASSLALLGSIALPEAEAGRELSDDYLNQCAESGANLLRNIPRLEEVAEIVARQRTTGPMPVQLNMETDTDRVAIGGRLLRFVVDWHREAKKIGNKRELALEKLRNSAPLYDGRLFDAAEKLITRESDPAGARSQWSAETVEIRDLRAGMVTKEDVTSVDGMLLVSKHQSLTPMAIERLRGFAKAGLIAVREVRVITPCEEEQRAA